MPCEDYVLLSGYFSSLHPCIPPPGSFALLDPILHRLPRAFHLLVHHLARNPPMRLHKVDALRPRLARPDMRVRHDGEPLLIGPGQVRDIAHGDRQDRPAHADAERGGDGRAQQDVTAARDDAAGHGGDQHVHQPGHQRLAGLGGRRERRDRVGEGLLEVEGARHAAVYGVLGAAGVPVQEEPRVAHVDGQAVGRGGPVGDGGVGAVGRGWGYWDGEGGGC